MLKRSKNAKKFWKPEKFEKPQDLWWSKNGKSENGEICSKSRKMIIKSEKDEKCWKSRYMIKKSKNGKMVGKKN